MGAAVAIPVRHGDPHRPPRPVSDSRHDTRITLTRQNQILRGWLIFQGKTKKQTNKHKRTASFLSIHLWPGNAINEYCNIQWIWRQIVFWYQNIYNKSHKETFKCLPINQAWARNIGRGQRFSTQSGQYTSFLFFLSFFHYFWFLC